MKRQRTGGRIKGTPNKTQAQIREAFQAIIDDNLDKLKTDIDGLEPEQRIKYIIDLAKFVVPHLKAVELTAEPEERLRPVIINLGSGIKPPEDE